jgi:transposase InsO family protein
MEDAELMRRIRSIIDVRATYGYRRVLAILNRQQVLENKPKLNHKRLYRLMREQGLLLTRHQGKPMERAHDGKVITLRPNTRWTTDGFEIPCENGEVVRVLFGLDTCDREILAFEASTEGFSGEMARNVMLKAVEYRFNALHTARRIEWLSDNGSCYRAKETIEFAVQLGLKPCFTPVRSPQSNGMAESFVKTFKRDYVYVNHRPDAKTVMAMLEGWFEDYNENHPHKGLRMKSPREFIRSVQPAACPVQ